MNESNLSERLLLSGIVTSTSNSQTGRRRISVSCDFAEYEQDQKTIFDSMFKELPVTVAVAVINNNAASDDMNKELVKLAPVIPEYGENAKTLRLSSFFSLNSFICISLLIKKHS